MLLLDVKGRAPKTGYDRDQYGPAWKDVDRNGCDTRNDILRRDLTAIVLKPSTQDCVVATGTLQDPYSGRAIDFVRGQETSSAVQIDHVVALSDSWQKGAQAWDATRREAFANDPLNLLAVDGPLNMQKGDGDAATWLPPNKALPVRVRRASGGREVHLRPVGHGGRARRDGPRPLDVPERAAARRDRPSRRRPPPGRRPLRPARLRLPRRSRRTGTRRTRAGARPVAPAAGRLRSRTAPRRGPPELPRCTGATPGTRRDLDRDNDGIGCEVRP